VADCQDTSEQFITKEEYEKRLRKFFPESLFRDRTGGLNCFAASEGLVPEDLDIEVFLKLFCIKLYEHYDLVQKFHQLFNIDEAPADHIADLGRNIGYVWDFDQDFCQQRFILKHLVEKYRKKATIPNMEEFARDCSEAMNPGSPAFHQITEMWRLIFRYDDSSYDSNHAYQDFLFYREGVYKFSTTDMECAKKTVGQFHPGGMYVWFCNIIELCPEVAPTISVPEMNMTVVINMFYNYNLDGVLIYDYPIGWDAGSYGGVSLRWPNWDIRQSRVWESFVEGFRHLWFSPIFLLSELPNDPQLGSPWNYQKDFDISQLPNP